MTKPMKKKESKQRCCSVGTTPSEKKEDMEKKVHVYHKKDRLSLYDTPGWSEAEKEWGVD